jgi:polyisoprenyl-phosphate glycosyltransferase
VEGTVVNDVPRTKDFLPEDSQGTAAIKSIALVSPVLDDWVSFAALIGEISSEFTGTGVTFHVCAIDDGSVTATDLHSIVLPPDTCIAEIEIIHLALNLGHQRAIAVGLCEIVDREGVDAVIVMDSDGEDRPIDIGTLLAETRERPGCIVLAERAKRSEARSFRFGYFIYKLLFRVLTGRVINFGNYLLLPMPSVRRLVHMPELWNHLAAAVIRSRYPYCTVPTVRGGRYHGRSTMNLVSLVVHGMSAMSVHTDMIFVRVLLGASVIVALSAAGIVGVVAVRFATDLAVPGWATTAVGVLLIILFQAFVTVIATSLSMLAGRINRPIIPVVDCRLFISRREFWRHGHTRTEMASQSRI